MGTLENKFKKEDDNEVYYYRCGGCGAEYKEKLSLCSKCLESNTIEKIVEEIVEGKEGFEVEAESEAKAVKGVESFEEFGKGLRGGYREAEEPKIQFKKAIVVKVKEKDAVSQPQKEEKLRLAFETNPEVEKEINAAKLEVNNFARWMGKALDEEKRETFKKLEAKLKDSVEECIEKIKNISVTQRESEAVDWLIDEIFKLEGISKEFASHKEKLIESFGRVKKSFQSQNFEKSMGLASEEINKKLADRAIFEDFILIMKKKEKFEGIRDEVIKKIERIIEKEIGEVWFEPTPSFYSRLLENIQAPQDAVETRKLLEAVKEKIRAGLREYGV